MRKTKIKKKKIEIDPAENWNIVEIYRIVNGELPMETGMNIGEALEEGIRVMQKFQKMWDKNPDRYNVSLFFLAKKKEIEYKERLICLKRNEKTKNKEENRNRS